MDEDVKNAVELVYPVFLHLISPHMGLSTREGWASLSPMRMAGDSL